MFPAIHDCHGCVRLDFRADIVREKGTERVKVYMGFFVNSPMFFSSEVSRLKR